ncbi:MAG TPA: peptidoglycan-binding protein, partial [Caulobacteraceae bacterium]
MAIAAGAATASSAARAAPYVPGGVGAQAEAFYAGFNDQLASFPEAQREDMRRLYELNGWRPLWTPELQRTLATAVGQAPRHGLSPRQHLDMALISGDPSKSDMRLSAAALAYARVLSQGSVQ